MEVKFYISNKERKALVAAIAKITGASSKYMGMPSMVYEIGYFTVDKNSILSFDDGEGSKEVETLLTQLAHSGFTSEEGIFIPVITDGPQIKSMGLTVAMPRDCFNEDSLGNLENLIASKTSLIKKALKLENLPIEVDEAKVSFPWFAIAPADSDEVKTYNHFIYALCEMARNQKRVNAKEKEVDNEKYAFRCFLLRLGFIGAEYKKERKILMQNLAGSAAFRSQDHKEVANNEVSK